MDVPQHGLLVGVQAAQAQAAQGREGHGAHGPVRAPYDRAAADPDPQPDVVAAHVDPGDPVPEADRAAEPLGEPVGQLVHSAVEPQQIGAGLGEDVVQETVEPAAAARANSRVRGEQRMQVDPVGRRSPKVRGEVDAGHQVEQLTAQVLAECRAQVRRGDGVDDGCEPGAEYEGAVVVAVFGEKVFELATEVLEQWTGGVPDADETVRGVEVGVFLRQECGEGAEFPVEFRPPNVFEGVVVMERNAHGAELHGRCARGAAEPVGEDTSTDAGVAFQDLDAVAELLQFEGRHEAGHAGPDDGDAASPLFVFIAGVGMPDRSVAGH